MISYARHIHVNSQDGTDVCKVCGHDLRHRIHSGMGYEKPVSDLIITIAEKAIDEAIIEAPTRSESRRLVDVLYRIKTLTESE